MIVRTLEECKNSERRIVSDNWESIRMLLKDGDKTYPINPGTLYILDKNDEHYLRAYKDKEMVMACVFNPPITGAEVHNENGVYPLVE
jgi:L-ectoine synthase